MHAIDAELGRLAHLSLRGGVGSIGYRSAAYKDAEHPLWIEIELGKEQVIDQLVLVPVLWRDTRRGFQADALPEAFNVRVGTAETKAGTVVAEFRSADSKVPRIAPVVVTFPKVRASWVRIEIPQLAQRLFDGQYSFQLSEILVFAGQKNVALRCPVRVSSPPAPNLSGAWEESYLVDGLMPYLMDSAYGNPSIAYISMAGYQPVLTIDLGEPRSFSEIHLHAVDQSDTVPQAFLGDLGIPQHFRIEGANREDFADAKVLLDYGLKSAYETGPIMMWNIPEATCRFVRLVVIEASRSLGPVSPLPRLGFAEIELVADGINVALNQNAQANPASQELRDPLNLTDGRNVFGEILPIRQWVNELARRHDLETERVVVAAELNRRYLRQKVALEWMTRLAVTLGVVIGFVILYDRMLRIRHEAKVRERIAANLHDELGANLHAIGLLGDIAEESVNSPERLIETVRRIRGLTERTGATARACTNMLEAKGVCEDMVAEMKLDARRLLADIDHEIVFRGTVALNKLKRRHRIDLVLFHKECLTNIIRHAHATRADILVSAGPRMVQLSVTDNGCGFSGKVPYSLQRRAGLLGGDFLVEHPPAGGTTIILKLKIRKFGIF